MSKRRRPRILVIIGVVLPICVGGLLIMDRLVSRRIGNFPEPWIGAPLRSDPTPPSNAPPRPPPPERILNFPQDYSLGQLSMRDWSGGKYEYMLEVRGEVIVPSGKYLFFSLEPNSSSSRVVDEYLATLVGIEGLDPQGLNVGALNFTDTSMELVASLKSLEELDIGGARGFTDSMLQQLRNLDSLRVLDLRETAVTNDGLQHLLTFPRLEWLDLSGTRIDGGAIKHLKKMSSLRHLFVGETNMSRRNAEKLKRALPYCRIGWSEYWKYSWTQHWSNRWKKATPPPTPTDADPVS